MSFTTSDTYIRNRLSRFRSALDQKTLTMSSFFASPPRAKQRIFFSQVEGLGQRQLEEPVNYQNLINKRFDSRTFRKVMSIYLKVDNIILEEKGTAEIAKDLRAEPRKRFSDRSSVGSQERPPESEEPATDNSNVTVNGTTKGTATRITSSNPQSLAVGLSLPSNDVSGSGKSLEGIDLARLTEEDIRLLIQRKMRKLERFNRQLEKRNVDVNALAESLSERQLQALIRFQIRCRGVLLKRKFICALRMNQSFEQKQNYLRLKKSMEVYQKRGAERSERDI